MNNIFSEIEKYRIELLGNVIYKNIKSFERKISFYNKYSNFDEENKFLLNSIIKKIDLINYEIISLQEEIIKRVINKNSFVSIKDIKEDDKKEIRNILSNEKKELKNINNNIIEIINNDIEESNIEIFEQ